MNDQIEVHWAGKVIIICECENEIHILKPEQTVQCLVCGRVFALCATVTTMVMEDEDARRES